LEHSGASTGGAWEGPPLREPCTLGEGRDVVILVEPLDRWGFEALEAVPRVSEALGVGEGLIDIVNVREAPCAVVRDAWRHGILLYEEDRGAMLNTLLPRLMVCLDYEVMARKLAATREAVRAVGRRWGNRGGYGEA
jgi:hypothetical protein